MHSKSDKINKLKLFWFSISVLVIIVDQATKWLSTQYFFLGESFKIFPGFDLTLRHNTGAAFSLFDEGGGWQRWFLAGLAIVISFTIIIWLSQLNKKDKIEGLALSLILGGAIGNLIDRLLHGYVIDFILWYYQEWSWPAFNIADSAISVGVFLLFLMLFRQSFASRI